MTRPDRADPEADLDRIFGAELPSESADASDPPADGADRDEWLLVNVPPHHR